MFCKFAAYFQNSFSWEHLWTTASVSGFGKSYWTSTSLAYLTNKILTDFHSGLLTGMILIDFQDAFDTINHFNLTKMASPGFSNHSIMWFQSYLSGRSFRVKTKNKHCSTAKICSFLKFLYADDSCLVYEHNDVSKIEQNLNKNFSNICNCFV